jgi:hypothetical protein
MMTTTVNFSRQLKLTIGALLAGILLICAAPQMPSVALGAPGFQLTPTDVLAEAIGEAIFAQAGVNTIRSEQSTMDSAMLLWRGMSFVPWLLIEYPLPRGAGLGIQRFGADFRSMEAVP